MRATSIRGASAAWPVRALAEQHVPEYRELMLEAYEHAADAFTSTVEERRAEPMSWWVKRIASPSGLSQAYGAWDNEALVGSVAVEFSAKPKTRHSALVLGMYVRPAYRGRGVGMALLQAAAEAAAERPGIRVLTLSLTEGNEPAMRLYLAAGFAVWGVEPLAISTGAGYKGKVHMSRRLHPAGPVA
ncbi:MAG: GNAT family N-acetyltransferase [Rubrivivax sp.]|nr:GNAT family N-acetyltransferase [Rubrivivax sp.]